MTLNLYLSSDLDWQISANCLGHDRLMFPPGDDPDIPQQAAQLCDTCPVHQQCLEYAVNNPPVGGIWAGKTADGIRRERRRRQAQRRKGVA